MPTERVTRRLAAILSADVVGYSRMMETDESATLVALRHWRDGVLTPSVDKYQGRIVKHLGDGALVEFSSAVDAVGCAIETQSAMASDGPPGFAIRTGVNVGEVVVEDDDIYGEGVNIAARLQAICAPGGLCISIGVHRMVEGKVDAVFEDGGKQSLKNIEAPIHVWHWQPNSAATADAGGAPAIEIPERPSVVVLPFDNMSADAEQEYFVDGMTEDIITDLSKISGLFVIARNTSFTYKGRSVAVPEVCAALAVRYALEGSVRKAGKRLRINAQLIDGTSGGHVWADRFDRDLDDVFALQDEVTQAIVDAMKVTLTPGEQERQDRRPEENVEAYELLLRARQAYYRFTAEGIAETRALCEQALAIDPDYAGPLGLLSESYLSEWFLARSRNPAESLDRAIETGRAAVARDPDLGPAHFALSFGLLWKREFDEAMSEAERAVELIPGNAIAHSRLSMALTWIGDAEAGLLQAKEAQRLDPGTPFPYGFVTGHALIMLGKFEAAVESFSREGAIPEGFAPGSLYLAAALAGAGDIEAANAAVQSTLRKSPNMGLDWAREILPYKRQEDLEFLVELWQKTELP